MKIALSLILIVIAFMTLQPNPALAQATRTWVSGVGDDVNPCSRTAPCKTFAGAISKTAAGGEINCIDPGGFGALTITKAITIDCSSTESGILVAGTNGFVVNAGASDVVTLRGLDFFGTIAGPALNGIVFNSGQALIVEKCVIRLFKAPGSSAGFGILFQPSSGTSGIYVSDTNITNNGTGSTGGGILIQPAGSGSATGMINRVNVNLSTTGITANGGSTTTSTFIFVQVRDSVLAGASVTGASAATPASGGVLTVLELVNSSSVDNVTGVSSNGSKSQVILTDSTVAGNGTGLAISSGGAIISYRNNFLNGNFSDGAAPLSTFTPN